MKIKSKLLSLTIIFVAGLLLASCTLTEQQQTETPSTVPKQVKPDKELIKEALIAKNGPGFTDVVLEITENTGQFAIGSVGNGPGGGMFFAAKVNGQWFIAWDGNGFIFCEDIKPYNFPNTIIPVCFDQKTNKEIQR